MDLKINQEIQFQYSGDTSTLKIEKIQEDKILLKGKLGKKGTTSTLSITKDNFLKKVESGQIILN